ncbi:MAG: mismatch-specific DNA-glycosylase [Nocardioidaceae bacterium]|nr:mismatch-specific DNA-glycosylase [Nocardioidaceae bacterium]
MGFTQAELERYRDATVPDLLGDDLRLLFVGINPGLWTAATGTHFARPGNRFWPALRLAGVVTGDLDPTRTLTVEETASITALGLGITNLAPRATARADELSAEELREGRARLEQLVATRRPAVVAVAGITAFRTAFGRPRTRAGRQPDDLHGAALWVVPNPSGLNAHETVSTLAAAYREVAVAAGIVA